MAGTAIAGYFILSVLLAVFFRWTVEFSVFSNHRVFWCQGLHPDMAPAIPIIIYLMLGYWVKTCENLEPPIQSFPGCYRHAPADEVTSLQNFSPVSLSWRWIPPSSASCAARQGLLKWKSDCFDAHSTPSWPLYHTVDGRNPAPVDMVNIPLCTVVLYIQTVVVWDFFHQQ